jgi:hypothetical protein
LTDGDPAPKPRIEELARSRAVDAFDCGAEPLNTYLKRFALGNQSAGAAQTYVAIADEHVIGYILTAADIVGVRTVMVHAKDKPARRFHKHFNFDPSPVDPLHLFLLLKEIARLVET